jgi:hypothetical protein
MAPAHWFTQASQIHGPALPGEGPRGPSSFFTWLAERPHPAHVALITSRDNAGRPPTPLRVETIVSRQIFGPTSGSVRTVES